MLNMGQSLLVYPKSVCRKSIVLRTSISPLHMLAVNQRQKHIWHSSLLPRPFL
nr:hypothetical protein Q903MT_gene172 [Picea sitchensis]